MEVSPSNEKVSIVVPCYQAERYIEHIVRDVLAQRGYLNWELLIVGNGPDQECQAALVRKIAANDPRIKYISLDASGVSKARNLGIDAATGSWVAFLDADDRIPDDWLIRYSRFFPAAPDMIAGGICEKRYGLTRVEERDLDVPETGICISNRQEFLRIYSSNDAVMYSPCSKMIRREFLLSERIRFDERLTVYEDGVFCLQVALACRSVCFLRQTGYCYCLRSGSAIGRYHESMQSALESRRALLHQLAVARDEVADELLRLDAYQYAADSLDVLLNTFRSGYPAGFESRVRLASHLFSDRKLRQSYEIVGRIKGNLPLKLFGCFSRLRAARLCICVFQLLIGVRNLGRRVK